MKEKLEKLDLLIRNGMGKFARQELRQIVSTKIKRENLYQVANLARRVNLPHFSIKLLNPIVRPSGKQKETPASIYERAEYAAALTYVGACEESFQILKQINPKDLPQVLLFQSFALFAQWDYASSIPLLEQYVVMPSLNSYDRLVGNVNLVAALIYERELVKAEQVIEDLKMSSMESNYSLLNGNILELSAQIYIFKKEYDKAAQALKIARKHLTQDAGHGGFFLKKWEVILNYLQSDDPVALQALHELKKESLSTHSETARVCDRFEAIKTQSKELFFHLYFGTPFESYRKRLLKDFGYVGTLPDCYQWNQLVKGETINYLNIKMGEGKTSRLKVVKVEGVLHKLLGAFTNDFYHSVRLPTLHHQLYPNEYYNPLSSSRRVHEAIRRLKIWFKENKIPLTIVENSSFYRLIALGSIQLTIPRVQNLNLNKDVFYNKILDKWPNTKFSAKEVSVAFDVSLRSAQRILLAYQGDGKLQRYGQAGATRYSIAQELESHLKAA